MKRILFTVYLLLSCTFIVMAQADSYKIEGNIGNTINGKLLLLANTDQGVVIEIGESDVINGVFKFTGRVTEDITIVYLVPKKKEPVLATFVLENANYTITMGTNELVVESDGEAQKAWKDFYELETFLLQNQQQLEMQARANPSQLQRLQQDFSKIESKVQEDELALIKKHSDSPVSALVIASKLETTFDDVALKERYEALGEKARATTYGKKVAAELVKLERVAIGAIAPNFTAPLADGGVLSLHEAKGKVKVVDFWASWCDPCRVENVNLIKIYKRYHPQGLEIISVSIDTDKQAWLTAIGQDGSNWKNVSELNEVSEIAVQYCVKGIPCSFILDEDNRIVAKNLRGKDLEKKITEMLKKKK